MRQAFGWAIGPSSADLKKIWTSSTLVVDANVLLDLYRYHENTREALLSAIENFRGRIWISNQAASEFFRNRNSVIMSSEKTFADAASAVEDLRKAAETAMAKLRGVRLIPRAAADDLRSETEVAVAKALATIGKAQAAHPEYIQNDQLLVRLMDLFDGKVGEAPESEELQNWTAEGERRIGEKIPPGYLDSDKEGGRSVGDFLHWRETLEFGKRSGAAIILVTSERKEDWWEKYSGKTVGARRELLEEAYKFMGRQILIYQTDYFLEVSAKQYGQDVDRASVEEIRDVGVDRYVKIYQPAVRVNQIIDSADQFDCSGVLEIELLRPLSQFTGSGAFSPHMSVVPSVYVEIAGTPEGCPAVVIAAATGTTFDFNVHIKSREKGVQLPAGRYAVKYSADIWDKILEGMGGEINEAEG